MIYAIYVIGAVAAMFFLGRLSDQVGRRLVVLISLGAAALSAIIFLLARDTPWLFPARILSGLAIALASGASTAWIVELEPKEQSGCDPGRERRQFVRLGPGAADRRTARAIRALPLRLSYVVFSASLRRLRLLRCDFAPSDWNRHRLASCQPVYCGSDLCRYYRIARERRVRH